MKPGEVVRVSLPESDGKVRSRPALLIKKIPPYNDWLLCAISSGKHLEQKGLDIMIDVKHSDFISSNLKFPGLIRTGFLFTIPESSIEGKMGTLSESTMVTVINNLVFFLKTK